MTCKPCKARSTTNVRPRNSSRTSTSVSNSSTSTVSKTNWKSRFNSTTTKQFCADVEDAAQSWHVSLDTAIDEADETIKDLTVPGSKHNEPFLKKFKPKLGTLKTTVAHARKISTSIDAVKAQLRALGAQLTTVKDGLKDEFAEVERKLVKSLAEQGVTSIQPNDYVTLVDRKKGLTAKIADQEKENDKESG